MQQPTDNPYSLAASEGPPDMDPIERIILQSMNEGVITVECSGTIHTVNPAAMRILGLEVGDLSGRHIEHAFPVGPDNDEFMKVFSRLIHHGLPTPHQEVTYRRPDGQRVDLSLATAFLRVDECVPQLQNAVAVFRDVTAYKSLERAKRRAVNHLSHELQTPLAIIQASVELLVEKINPRVSVDKTVSRIRRNIQRLKDIQEIVEEITNPREFHPHPFDLRETIENIIGEVRTADAHRSVLVRAQIDPAWIDHLDPDLLELVLKTLLKNAIENTPDEGEVFVSAKQIGMSLVLDVEDHGVGIPLADQEFIFEGFHHTQATDQYSSKRPFDFNAGGKGLELLRLKMLSEAGWFDISFKSERCRFIPSTLDNCPGCISDCQHVEGIGGCKGTGGTTFSVVFSPKKL